MTWNATRTWAVGDLFTAGDANNILRDDVQYNRDTVRAGAALVNSAAAWGNSASTAFADFGGASAVQIANFVKRQGDSSLLIEAYGSCFQNSGAADIARFGVKIGATDYAGGQLYFSSLLVHQTFYSGWNISGLAAGTYTITLRVKSGSVGAINTDANDSFAMEVWEASLD